VEELLGVVVRLTITYFYLLAAVRATGKRTIGQLSIPDAAVAFVVGDMFDNIVWGKVETARGLVAVGVVLLLHVLVVYAVYRWRAFAHLVEGEPTTVVRAGHLVAGGMRHEHMPEAELRFLLREKGVERVEEVELACQESHDHVSALKKRAYRAAQKIDLPKLEAALR
jgi:uncharacterized membrane protein YcaP (DUF421 family)